MSKLESKPVMIKEGVTLKKEGNTLLVQGPLGETKVFISPSVNLEILSDSVWVKSENKDKRTKAILGTTVRLIGNAIEGVIKGYNKTLEIIGTGFRAQKEGEDLVLFLGFSHPIRFTTPEGTKIEVQENKIIISGTDKDKVGLTTEKIKKFKKPDAYKGKGIRFLGEKIKLKPGKAAAKVGTTK